MNVVAMVLDYPPRTIGWKVCVSRTDEQLNPSVAVNHSVGKLSMTEKNIEVQHKAP